MFRRYEPRDEHDKWIIVNLPYPRTTQRSISRTLGALPCMRIPTRKIRAAAHAVPIVHANTPTTPTQGCQAGTPPGMACRISISIGVKGGNSDTAVARTPFGCFMIGIMMHSGITTGESRTIARLWASCAVLQADAD